MNLAQFAAEEPEQRKAPGQKESGCPTIRRAYVASGDSGLAEYNIVDRTIPGSPELNDKRAGGGEIWRKGVVARTCYVKR